MNDLIPRSKSDWFRLAWVMSVNGFFAAEATFNVWKDYAGIGLPRNGLANVSGISLAMIFVLALGVVLEVLRIRGAAVVNVGIYAVAVLGTVFSATRSLRIEPLALVGGALFA